MQQLVLIITAAALVSTGFSSNVNRQINMVPDLDNSIEHSVPTKQSKERKFLALTQRPTAVNLHPPGKVLELTCEAIGAPAPTIHWYKNDAPVYEHYIESHEVSEINPTSLGTVTSTLLVPHTHGRDQYTCVATAGRNTTRATTTIYSTDGATDIERSVLVPLAPRIVVSYKVFMDTIGNNIVVPCKAKGHPRPHVTWRDNNGALVKKDPRMKVLRSGELVITGVRWSDMGEYTCQATNVFGTDVAATFVYPTKAG